MAEQAHSIWFKADVDGFDTLVDLALNLRWSWSHGEEELWEPLDPELWELTHNPWLVLQTASRSKLKSLMADANFRRRIAVRQSHHVLARQGLPAAAGSRQHGLAETRPMQQVFGNGANVQRT